MAALLGLGLVLPVGTLHDGPGGLTTESVLTLPVAPTFVPGLTDQLWGLALGGRTLLLLTVLLIIVLLPAVARDRARSWLDLARPIVAVPIVVCSLWVVWLGFQFDDAGLAGYPGWVLLGGSVAAIVISMRDFGSRRALAAERALEADRQAGAAR